MPAPKVAKAPKKRSFQEAFNASQSSGFPNIDEEYTCTFVEQRVITSAKTGQNYTLLVLDTTNSRDQSARMSTIVQTPIDEDEVDLNETITVITERRENSDYPRFVRE